MNDLSAYSTPESPAAQVMGAGSESDSPGAGADDVTPFDEPTAAPAGDDEPSSALPASTLPASTRGEGIQDAPLDAPPEEVPTSTSVASEDAIAPTPEPAADAATISSSIPADGALGVSPDVVLLIDFGRAMDPSTLPRVIVSDDLPLAGAVFAWNADNSVVNITLAEPLAVASGNDPAQVKALCYSYRISDGALDVDGNAVLPSDISFCTARRITQTLPAVSDADLSGNFRSDDGYGDGACSRGANAVCVGDSGFAANSAYRGFLTFDSSVLPEPMVLTEAELRIEPTPDAGTPFEDLGELLVEQTRFERIGTAAFRDADLAQLGVMERAPNAGTTLLGDLATLRIDESDRIQLRLRFTDGTDRDGRADHIVTLVNAVSLTVSYDVP